MDTKKQAVVFQQPLGGWRRSSDGNTCDTCPPKPPLLSPPNYQSGSLGRKERISFVDLLSVFFLPDKWKTGPLTDAHVSSPHPHIHKHITTAHLNPHTRVLTVSIIHFTTHTETLTD